MRTARVTAAACLLSAPLGCAEPISSVAADGGDAGADGAAACPPGEQPVDGGGCEPAGIGAKLCGQGFMSDGDGGCRAVLPPVPCPSGLFAIPGEESCHPVAPCNWWQDHTPSGVRAPGRRHRC